MYLELKFQISSDFFFYQSDIINRYLNETDSRGRWYSDHTCQGLLQRTDWSVGGASLCFDLCSRAGSADLQLTNKISKSASGPNWSLCELFQHAAAVLQQHVVASDTVSFGRMNVQPIRVQDGVKVSKPQEVEHNINKRYSSLELHVYFLLVFQNQITLVTWPPWTLCQFLVLATETVRHLGQVTHHLVHQP